MTGGPTAFPARIRLQIVCGRACFFGAPLDFQGGPLDLPWGASGRLGAHFAASGFALLICSSLSLRRPLVFSKIFGACGGFFAFFAFSKKAIRCKRCNRMDTLISPNYHVTLCAKTIGIIVDVVGHGPRAGLHDARWAAG